MDKKQGRFYCKDKQGIPMSISVLGIGDNVVDKYLHSGIMYPGGIRIKFAVYAKLVTSPARLWGRLAMTTPRSTYRMYYTSYR